MLCRRRHAKRKILYQTHSFWILLVCCVVLDGFCGLLLVLLGLPEAAGNLFLFFPAALVEEYRFVQAFALCYRYVLFLFLCSFSVLAVYLVPCALFVRGFLLTYSIGCYTALYGAGGFLTAFQLNLYHGILMLPILLLLGGWSFARQERTLNRQSFKVGAVMTGVSLVMAVPEYCLTPWIAGSLMAAFQIV